MTHPVISENKFARRVARSGLKSHEELREVARSRLKSCAKWPTDARRVARSGLKSHEGLCEAAHRRPNVCDYLRIVFLFLVNLPPPLRVLLVKIFTASLFNESYTKYTE